jgi:hypothetical protein
MERYASNCVKMYLKTDKPPIPGKSPVLMFGQDYFKDATNWVEITTVTGNFMMMEGTPKSAEKIIHVGPDGHKGGPYPKWNRNADKMMFFSGTDSTNLNDLGAQVEFHLGEGEDEEVFEFDEPRCVFIPKGVRHGPIYVTKFRRNLIIFAVLAAPTREAAGIVTDFDYIADEGKLRLD